MPRTGKSDEFSLSHFLLAQLYISTVPFVWTLGFVVMDLDWEINPIAGFFFCNLSYYVS